MSEESRPKSLEEMHQESLRKDREKTERMEAVRLETIKRLQTDPAILKYFEQFNKHSVENFIPGYANLKKSFMEYGEQFGQISESYNLAYFEDAKSCLRIIQQKKLFDMRCQWGADKIQIPQIKTSWDFLYWSYCVFNCPFITPISSEEFELFMQFTATDNFDVSEAERLDWLYIENMRSGNTDDEAGLPEWFYFHNTHTNASMYFALPDLRGEKEILYRNLWRKEQDEIREQKFQTGELKRPGPADERPQLTSYQFEHIEEFVKKFEDPATQKKFYGYESYSSSISRDSEGDSDYYNEQALEIIHKIINLGQVISVEPNADIRIAIMDAWAKFERGQTISCLPSAYQDYRFRVESKIPFETESLAEHSSDLAKSVEEQVLRGRELNGEPRNLDF